MKADTQKFESLVAPHFDALYRAALRLTRRSHDAEDLVQEVCLRAFRELQTIERLESVLGWLLRVQYRVFVDGDRRRRRSPVQSLGPSRDGSEIWFCDAPGPDELADGAQQHRRLLAAWDRLTPEQRALLALHAEGYGLPELERITGKDRNTLSARLHRARRRLSKLLYGDAPTVESLQPKVTRE